MRFIVFIVYWLSHFNWNWLTEIQHIVDSGNSSLLQILRQAQQNTTEPKVGELTNFNSKNFSLTFGNFIFYIIKKYYIMMDSMIVLIINVLNRSKLQILLSLPQ